MNPLLKALKYCLFFALTLFIIWGAGLLAFLQYLEKPASGPFTRADAIIVLTGGKGRLETGLHLLKAGYAEKLFISGVGKATKFDEIKLFETIAPEEKEDYKTRIFLGRAATSTFGNAQESSEFVKENSIHSIILVTADFHMARSILEFKNAMPKLEIIPFSVEDGNKNLQNETQARKVLLEYNKLIIKTLMILIDNQYFEKLKESLK